jgi:hypothetical protein
MSILRIVSGPPDIGPGGYTFMTNGVNYSPERVGGTFRVTNAGALAVPHKAPAATEVWYHFRYAIGQIDNSFTTGIVVAILDGNSNVLATLNYNQGDIRVSAIGTTTSNSGYLRLAQNSPYSVDLQVIVGATTTVRWYLNGALYGERTVTTGVGFGVPRAMNFQWNTTIASTLHYFSEVIIADEDTRGMRLRELRPTAFGLFQEWDGSIVSLRDSDLATGISTDTADRRVSFGVSNLEFIQPGDIINRVVCQSYGQRGEAGLTQFNHFFRYRDGTTEDGADQTLSLFGDYFLEEFVDNPKTLAPWVPDDFRSLQTGVRSRA